MPDTILDGSGEQTPGRAFYPLCALAGPRPRIPTMILIGALDDWTPVQTARIRSPAGALRGRQ